MCKLAKVHDIFKCTKNGELWGHTLVLLQNKNHYTVLYRVQKCEQKARKGLSVAQKKPDIHGIIKYNIGA